MTTENTQDASPKYQLDSPALQPLTLCLAIATSIAIVSCLTTPARPLDLLLDAPSAGEAAEWHRVIDSAHPAETNISMTRWWAMYRRLDDDWLRREVRPHIEHSGLVHLTLAAGLVGRFGNGPRGLTDAQSSSLPIAFARVLTDEQLEELRDVTEDLSIWLRSDMARLWSTFARADTVWLDGVLVALQRRDDLECILWVLRQAGDKRPQSDDLAALDTAGDAFLATLTRWTAPGVDERIQRARRVSPNGWWTSPAEWADPIPRDAMQVRVAADP